MNTHRSLLKCLIILSFSLPVQGHGQKPARYKDSSVPVQVRVDDLMNRMTPEEKMAQLQSQLLFLPKYAQGRDFTVGHFRNVAHFMHTQAPATAGSCAAAINEDIELYLHQDLAEVVRPVKELKAFKRVTLAPGESREVILTLPYRSFGYWDKQLKFVVEPGTFTLYISRDASTDLLKAQVTVAGQPH